MTTETREDLMLPNYSETELNSNVTNAKLSKKKNAFMVQTIQIIYPPLQYGGLGLGLETL